MRISSHDARWGALLAVLVLVVMAMTTGAFAAGEEVERLSFISWPPTTVISTFFFCASSIATAMPLVNMLHFMSGISFERYIAVVPPSMNREQFSSMRLAAFCAILIFSSVWMVVFLVYGSPDTFCTSFTDIAPPRTRMMRPSCSS